MESAINIAKELVSPNLSENDDAELVDINKHVSRAFEKIAPFWPLKNLIAANPLKGFESLSFEKAIEEGKNYFQLDNIPNPLEQINIETIKWCQAFFDEGQGTIKMPLRDQGFYQCFRHLAFFDKNLHRFDDEKRNFIRTLPSNPEHAIKLCLKKLEIEVEKYTQFLSLLITTLPGWASYVCYRTEWYQINSQQFSVTQVDYIAMRIIITYLMWPKANELCDWYHNEKFSSNKKSITNIVEKINENEHRYRDSLLTLLKKNIHQIKKSDEIPKAQMVFCIDVRSEPFRRAIELQGNYETFGFAGFFGIPVQINNELCDSNYASCPVLISPKHTINEEISCSDSSKMKILQKKRLIKTMHRIYQMLKYMFTTPFTLVEILGPWIGLWMLMRTVAPITTTRFKDKYLEFSPESVPVIPILKNHNEVNGISFREQCAYAENFLRMIGLTKKFAPLIIICGHGADTENNAYHSALDCGACGGHNGTPNARILTMILNDKRIRNYLEEQNIRIPRKSIFVPALHNTTTDEVIILENKSILEDKSIQQLTFDLLSARKQNNQSRAEKLSFKSIRNSLNHIKRRSSDWAQMRPEWGLARNAAFIVAPRNLTKEIDLDGRAFLHSYDWEEDQEGTSLTAILTAPMIVAQWINYQYLFSTLDNVAYGSGSKITHNITGKIGVMQGNASDLMHGLPLQSVNISDEEQYHEPLRLLTVVFAPRFRIENIIAKEEILQKIFKNSWVCLVCFDPNNNEIYILGTDLNWQQYKSHSIKHG